MRRLFAAAVFMALAACASPRPAHADPFTSAQPGLLHACVDAAGAQREALEGCLGALARPCIAQEGPSTMAEVLCWSAESQTWDQIIAAATTRLSAREQYRDPQRLAAANQAWAAWLEAECEYWAWQEGGGSGEQVDRVECAARMSAERAIALIAAAPR